MSSGSSRRKGPAKEPRHGPEPEAGPEAEAAWLGRYRGGASVWSENSGPASTSCAAASQCSSAGEITLNHFIFLMKLACA